MICLEVDNGKKIAIDDDVFDVLWSSIEETEEETSKEGKRKRSEKISNDIQIISLTESEDISMRILNAMTDVMNVKSARK